MQTSNGNPLPAYWPDKGWVAGWGKAGNGEEYRLAEDLPVPGTGTATYYTADLYFGTDVSRAICSYLRRSTRNLKYKSQTREATRMVRAQNLLAANATATASGNKPTLTHKQQQGLTANLREGKRGGPTAPKSGAVEIQRIMIVRNDTLWDRYYDTREDLRDELAGSDPMSKVTWSYSYASNNPALPSIPVLDSDVGETLLLHGTTREVMKIIANGGFKPDFGGSKSDDPDKPNYGALGQGSYFSDNFAKVMTYTACKRCLQYRCNCASGDDGLQKRVTLLSRVLLGRPKKMHGFLQQGGNLRSQSVNENKAGRHSVYAQGTGKNLFSRAAGSNEFVVKNAAQIYPEFVIWWTHDT